MSVALQVLLLVVAIVVAVAGLGVALPESGERPFKLEWLFATVAVFAMVVSVLVIVMLMAQALGPNPCLTQLSYDTSAMDISWTGKIPPMGR